MTYAAILDTLYDHDEPATYFVEVPPFIEPDITTGTVASIIEGGCESGAYMPAVTSEIALETMRLWGDEVFDHLAGSGNALVDFSADYWAGLATRWLSGAVETWANSVAEELARAIEDEAA